MIRGQAYRDGTGKSSTRLSPNCPVYDHVFVSCTEGGIGRLMARKFTLARKHADKHLLYQLAVQDPEFEVEFAAQQYEKRRGKKPRVLREDFCGTAAVACRWVEHDPTFRAMGLDLDEPTLAWARAHNVDALGTSRDRIDLRRRDVRSVTNPKADVIQAFNFSSYLFSPMSELVRYFRCVRRSLAPGGIFMVDGYGGWESQQVMRERRTIESPDGTFGFIWHQAGFNPITNRALCHIHFEFKHGKVWKRVFTYDWRMYSPAEMCDALDAAGFHNVEVYWDLEDDEDKSDFRPASRRKIENSPGWIFYVIADGSPAGS